MPDNSGQTPSPAGLPEGITAKELREALDFIKQQKENQPQEHELLTAFGKYINSDAEKRAASDLEKAARQSPLLRAALKNDKSGKLVKGLLTNLKRRVEKDGQPYQEAFKESLSEAVSLAELLRPEVPDNPTGYAGLGSGAGHTPSPLQPPKVPEVTSEVIGDPSKFSDVVRALRQNFDYEQAMKEDV